MREEDFLKLKSGTDVRGTALGEKTDLTDEAVDAIVRAFLYWIEEKTGNRAKIIAVGHDSRLSAERICKTAVSAAQASGADVLFCGLSSTPSMFMLLQEKEFCADASIMITASHMPGDKNGLKFFLPDGGLESRDVTEILKLAAKGTTLSGAGRVQTLDYMPRYAAALVEKVRAATGKDKPLAGKKIIVDAGNGAGGFYVDKVLVPLGADTEGSRFLEPDGNFPNHIPNPENERAMEAICEQVKKTGADLGIIFDTDVDRAGAVDDTGAEINRNRLIALVSAILLSERAGGTIVTDSVTSEHLTEFIEKHGGRHHRFKRGYKNVIDEAKRLNDEGVYSPLAIETSGHAALKENYFLDDGAYLVTRILISVAKGENVRDLISGLKTPAEEGEVRLPFSDGADFKTLGETVLQDLKSAAAGEGLSLAEKNYEGVRLLFGKGRGDGWALVRMSLHEPIMPVNFESNVKGGMAVIAKTLYSLLGKYDFLKADPLKKFF